MAFYVKYNQNQAVGIKLKERSTLKSLCDVQSMLFLVICYCLFSVAYFPLIIINFYWRDFLQYFTSHDPREHVEVEIIWTQ